MATLIGYINYGRQTQRWHRFGGHARMAKNKNVQKRVLDRLPLQMMQLCVGGIYPRTCTLHI